MSRALITIRDGQDRERATRWIERAPCGTRVEFKATKRSLPQNAKLHASITDVASQLRWFGKSLTVTQWKLIFLDALNRESNLIPNIDGTGFVDVGRSSSDLSKDECSQLIEIVLAFGAQHGVVFHDSESPSLAPEQEQQMAEAQ